MSLYNMVHGMNATLAMLVSPFLPRAADAFPRFRDVFLEADDAPTKGDIYVYTRMGGGNRECLDDCEDESCQACDARHIEAEPTCICRYDDDFDCTFSTFVFRVADEHRADFAALLAREYPKLSDWYIAKLRECFCGREKIDALIDKLDAARHLTEE